MNFNNITELYNRLKPALNSKEQEFYNLGFEHLKKDDIWNFLKDNKWSKTKDLNLYQMVDDIMNIDYIQLDAYIKKRNLGELWKI